MKKALLSLIFSGYTFCYAQQSEINFLHQNIDFSAAPRTSINPMSIKMWDNYNNGGPSTYGTVLEFYGRSGHQTGQFYFGGVDNSRIKYREAFYSENNWSNWVTLLDSKNNLETAGNLMVNGVGSHFIGSGNLGIGTTTPQEKLDVHGNVLIRGGINSVLAHPEVGGVIQISNPAKTTNGTANQWAIYNMGGSYGNSLQFWAYDNVGCAGGLCDNRLTLMDNGNVGIGTRTPKEKLSVNGKIRAHEVKVEAANWPDYVFEENYKNRSLTELEQFIKANKRLPEIPSANAVEQNGIELGEMNKLLLKKIEELTLLLIEQNKRVEKLEKNQKP